MKVHEILDAFRRKGAAPDGRPAEGVCGPGRETSPTPYRKTRYWFCAVVAFGTAVTAVVWMQVRNKECLSFKTQFERDADARADLVKEKLDKSLVGVESLEHVLLVSEQSRRTQFAQCAANFVSENVCMGIRSLVWAPVVPREKRGEIEEEARRQLGASFQIWEYDAAGHLVPARDRDAFYPVCLVDDQARSAAAAGFDIGSDSVRLAALVEARDSGRPAATECVNRASEENEPTVFLLAPVFDCGTMDASAADRRAGIKGYIQAAFSVEKLVSAAIRPTRPIGIDTALYDLSAADGHSLIYRWIPRLQAKRTWTSWLYPSTPQTARELAFGGRRWVLEMSPNLAYAQNHASIGGWAILPVGMLFTFLLAFYFRILLLMQQRRADAGERKRALELQRKEVQRGQFLLELYRKAPLLSEDDLYRTVLDHVIALTDSEIGFFHLVSEDQKDVVLTAWNQKSLETCTATYRAHYPLEQAGNWVDCIRQGHAVVYNDFPNSPNQKGLPEGHTPIRRFMSIPVMEEDKVRMIFGVGNKAELYQEQDVIQIQLVADELHRIIKQRHLQDSLRDSEQRMHLAADATEVGIWEWNVETNSIRWDPHMFSIYGLVPTPNSAVDYSVWSQAILPEDLPLQEAVLQEAVLREGHSVHEFRIRRCSDGRVRFIQAAEIVRTDADGQAKCVVGTNLDITEQKQIAESLRVSEAKFRGMVDSIGMGICLIDKEMHVLEMNRTLRDWFAGADPECRPICYRVFSNPPQEHACSGCPTARTLQDGKINEGCREVNSGKRKHTFRIVASPIIDARGEIVAAIEMIEDITERVSLESQLHQAQKMEAVGQLAGGVAHDFNNILQAMIGYGTLLSEGIPQEDERHEFIEEILGGAERASVLTRQLLAFSRRQVLEMENLDPNDVVNGVMKMIRRVISEDIEMKVMEGCGLGTIHADRGQMEQVLLNLCVNARDAMPKGGVLSIETEDVFMDDAYCAVHAWAAPGRYVLLRVADTGCGMDSETQSRIFEPFFTTKEPGKGTGLGLATVYGIVRQHQGMIQVYSEPGKGSVFKVYLPTVERPVAKAEAKRVRRTQGGAETILVAEDDEILRKLTANILRHAGYTVLLANNGQEALEVFEQNKETVALVLLDMVMPKLGGRAVYDTLCLRYPHLRFLFSSGYSTDSLETGFVLHEGIELIQKPYAPDALLCKVREVLDAHKAPAASQA